ncbi:MAG: hypothetical protein AAF734_05885 [Bacteroidota bacterium]
MRLNQLQTILKLSKWRTAKGITVSIRHKDYERPRTVTDIKVTANKPKYYAADKKTEVDPKKAKFKVQEYVVLKDNEFVFPHRKYYFRKGYIFTFYDPI